MSLKSSLLSLKNNYTKVIENYFFMTFLQVLNSVFGFITYPYLIRALGPSEYGIYVFGMSISSYFISLVSFGFNYPGLKIIASNKTDKIIQNKVLSAIFTAKLYLTIFSSFIFFILILTIHKLGANWAIYSICFIQLISELFIPNWYFQGIQKMKVITLIQAAVRLISIPFIFVFITKPEHLIYYPVISTSVIVCIALWTTLYLKYKEDIEIKIEKIALLKPYFTDAFPFFLSSIVSTIRQESSTLIIGIFFGMKEVAIFDLANKIISIPRILTSNINGALFPHVIENNKQRTIMKILKSEFVVGIFITILLAIFGYWIVIILGGRQMIDAYPITIILSTTILVWLIISSIVNFIFIPTKNYFYVTRNQTIALVSFIILAIIGIHLYHNIITLALAIAFSGILEIIYCSYIVKKQKLL